jgi:hypothetical protein
MIVNLYVQQSKYVNTLLYRNMYTIYILCDIIVRKF